MPKPPALPLVTAYQSCLFLTRCRATPPVGCCQADGQFRPITPPAAISGRNGMAAISCAFGRYGQFVAAPVRAGQGATFQAQNSKAPMGFSSVRHTAGGSQYPPAVPPSRAVARPGTPPSERRGGVLLVRAPDHGPIEALTEKNSVRVGGELFPWSGAILSSGPAAHGREAGERRDTSLVTAPESLVTSSAAMRRRASVRRGLKRYGTCSRVHLSRPTTKGGSTPHEAPPLT